MKKKNQSSSKRPETDGTPRTLTTKIPGNAAQYQRLQGRQLDGLKITLQIIAKGSMTLKLDLYEYKQEEKACTIITERSGLPKDRVETDLMQLTSLLEQYRDKQLHKAGGRQESKIQIPAATATKCIKFLKAEKLVQRINQPVGKAGITGEETNRILLFVIASSYKMSDTLQALIQGSSGSGKTGLLKVISYLMPDDDVKRYTRVTDNSFYNQNEYFFVNKPLCFEDLDGLKEEA